MLCWGLLLRKSNYKSTFKHLPSRAARLLLAQIRRSPAHLAVRGGTKDAQGAWTSKRAHLRGRIAEERPLHLQDAVAAHAVRLGEGRESMLPVT